MPLTVEVVTAERVVRVEQGVDVLVAPGSEGQLAILPHHAALMTTLDAGELIIRRASQEDSFVVSGGFMEVNKDRVTILADASEAAEEIDIARAAAALQRSLLRLRVANRRRQRPGPPRV